MASNPLSDLTPETMRGCVVLLVVLGAIAFLGGVAVGILSWMVRGGS